MKTNDLYKNLLDINNIKKAYKNVLKNIKSLKYKENLIKNEIHYISYVYRTIYNRKYKPKKKIRFFVNESGKKRDVYAQLPEDKIINHLVANEVLDKVIPRVLIDQNIASRKYLGTEVGISYFYKYIDASNRQWKHYYIIKGDIHKFFASLDHNILIKKLKKLIKDKEVIDILNTIIRSDEKGLSLGSMTSQILAVFYLNDFDHYIKEKLKVKRYVRYQDDFLIFVKTKKEANEILKKIEVFLKTEKLELNKSTRVYSSNENIKFLGKTKKGKFVRGKKAKKKLKKRIKEYKKGKKPLINTISSVQSYYGKINKDVFKYL